MFDWFRKKGETKLEDAVQQEKVVEPEKPWSYWQGSFHTWVDEPKKYCKTHGCKLVYTVYSFTKGYNQDTGIAQQTEVERWNCQRESCASYYGRYIREYEDPTISPECSDA